MRKQVPALLLCVFLMGCETASNQVSSGADYLDKYKDVPTTKAGSDKATSLDQKIREAAAVEPILKFPARIGLARIDRGSISSIPPEEGVA